MSKDLSYFAEDDETTLLIHEQPSSLNRNNVAAMMSSLSRYNPPILPAPLAGGNFTFFTLYTQPKSAADAETLSNTEAWLLRSQQRTKQEEKQEENIAVQYDRLSNLLILGVTILCSFVSGLQYGFGLFFYEYLSEDRTIHPSTACLILSVFYAFLTFGSLIARLLCDSKFSPISSMLAFSALSFAASIMLFLCYNNTSLSLLMFTGLLLFGVSLGSIFTASIDLLRETLSDFLFHDIASITVFGIECGEIFVPLLMGFFYVWFFGRNIWRNCNYIYNNLYVIFYALRL